MPELEPGRLYVVATPIGNLGDVTLRALETLGAADAIYAEDTRHTRRLLERHGIAARPISAHAHNERARARELVARLEAGERVALVTDAGTPGLSDPGARLVAAAVAAGHPAVPVPGPSALAAALSVSGFPADDVRFAGFLPARAAARRRRLAELLAAGVSTVFFEAPHRIRETLALLAELAPEREIAACRELTKRFEEVLRGRAGTIAAGLDAERERGEWTVVVSAAPAAGRGAGKGETEGEAAAPEAEAFERGLVEQGLDPSEARRRTEFVYGRGGRKR